MKNRLPILFTLLASSVLFLTGCSDNNESFEGARSTSAAPENDGLISQNNLTITFSELSPEYFNIAENNFTSVTVDVIVQIGDNNNQLITAEKTIRFRTEWGLIDPSCKTIDGSCSVTWRSTSPDDMPTNFLNNILAYSSSGQESFDDIDGNGLFNDGDNFDDLDEPYVDVNENDLFDTGDIIVDTINGVDLTGTDATHNDVDGLYNGPNCSHSSLCSPTRDTTTVWENGSLRLTGATVSTVGGTVTGLTGTLLLQNNGGDTLTITADGEFTFDTSLFPGNTYNVTVLAPQPVGLTCSTVIPGTTTNTGVGTVVGNITSVTVTCQ